MAVDRLRECANVVALSEELDVHRRLLYSRDSNRIQQRVRIPMMSISHSDLMSIRSVRSDAELTQCELVIDVRQAFWWFS
jgi:hypothetical protein